MILDNGDNKNTKATLLKTLSTRSRLSCVHKCKQTTGCDSISFSAGVCSILKEDPQGIEFGQAIWKVVFHKVRYK